MKYVESFFTKKWLTSRIEQEHQSNNNNNKSILPAKQNYNNNPNVSTLENHRHVIIGPSNVSKTYYLLELLETIGHRRPIDIITRSPNQYPN